LDFLKDSILFEEDFDTHRSKVHKEAARAEPEDFLGEVAYDCVERVRKVDDLLPDRNIRAFEDFAVGKPTLAFLRGRLLSTSEELVLRALTVTGLAA
jgi:hypothetical protein